MLQTSNEKMDSPKQNDSWDFVGCFLDQNDQAPNGTANISLGGNSTTCSESPFTPGTPQPRKKGKDMNLSYYHFI